MTFRPWQITVLLLVAAPGAAHAQTGSTAGPAITRPTISPALIPGAEATVARPAAQLRCPECNPPKQFWPAFGELMGVQMIPFSVNHFMRDAEWADISPASWLSNLENPWVWDNNAFLNNQFSHPYHGSQYYSAGRANGFNFWESSLFSLGGSLMWEEMFEVWAPSPNDWLNTGLGGITIGESLYKLSSLLLDNTATGAGRTWREIAAAIVNPVRGFDRLVDGRMNDVTANPPDWRPAKIQASFDAGGRVQTGGGNSATSASAMLWLWYNDQVADVTKKPFTVIRGNLELASNNKDATSGSTLNALNFRGNLGGWQLSKSDKAEHNFAAYIRYEYLNGRTLEFGGQGFNAGLVSRFGGRRDQDFRLDLEVLADFMAIAAVRSDYYETEEGRDYDYGLGLGGLGEARAIWPGKAVIRLQARSLWQPTLSGFNGYHTQTSLAAEGRYYLGGRFGVGAAATYYRSNGVYDDFDDVKREGAQYRLFASYAFPRWEGR
jgi:hypothetical protein